MTIKYKNVYVNAWATVAGPYETNGPLRCYFDKTYDEFYFGKKTWEQAEAKLIKEAVDLLLFKTKQTKKDINLVISGDLLNQLMASNFGLKTYGIPYLGIYSACATSVESMIIASNMIDAKQIGNCICTTSSHNNGAEKQFRAPVEYGCPKPKISTFTCTGAAASLLSSKKSKIRVESSTIGTIQDMGVKDPYNMGGVMSPAAANTLYNHLTELERTPDYYDLILTGDLGVYGKEIFQKYLYETYKIKLKKYDDTATMIFDLANQEVYAGASGPACAPLVTYSYVFDQMLKGKLKKVLLIATGSLHSLASVNQKLTIPSIAHAISLEVL